MRSDRHITTARFPNVLTLIYPATQVKDLDTYMTATDIKKAIGIIISLDLSPLQQHLYSDQARLVMVSH
jgi:hypothetical protein